MAADEIPEPATVSLLALGGSALIRCPRRLDVCAFPGKHLRHIGPGKTLEKKDASVPTVPGRGVVEIPSPPAARPGLQHALDHSRCKPCYLRRPKWRGKLRMIRRLASPRISLPSGSCMLRMGEPG